MTRLNEYQHEMIRHGITTLFQTKSLFWITEGGRNRQVASIWRMTNNTSIPPVSARATSRISLPISDLSQLPVTLNQSYQVISGYPPLCQVPSAGLGGSNPRSAACLSCLLPAVHRMLVQVESDREPARVPNLSWDLFRLALDLPFLSKSGNSSTASNKDMPVQV
jgi:hypothetical protein